MKKSLLNIITLQNPLSSSSRTGHTESSNINEPALRLPAFTGKRRRPASSGPGLCLKLLILAYCILMPMLTQAKETGTYELALSFAPEIHELTGTAKISIPPGQGLKLFSGRLKISGSLLRTEDGTEYILAQQDEAITLAAHQKRRVLFLSYTCSAADTSSNVISNEGIALTNNWFPIPEEPMLFSITAELPEHFSAIVETDNFPLARAGNTVNAVYSRPTTALHFIAGPYIVDRLRVRDGFYVYTMFFREDRDLAQDYLQTAREYLLKYENQIGPFPYNHYVIVSNRMPTGYGMPTFTLLGQMLLPLPFIKTGSLSHEIVHSWFGNSVEVDISSGNWCEGLTAFLSDQQLKEEQGEGVSYRKEAITKYLNYATTSSPLTLEQFTSASHNQREAETKRAVGYNRGLMLFSELHEKLGTAVFQKGLFHFYSHNMFNQASWDDIRKSFEAVSAFDLDNFFKERLSRKDIPSLRIKNVEITSSGSNPELTFDLIQETAQPYSLSVPIHIETIEGTTRTRREITKLNTRVVIQLKQRPVMFSIDPELTILRELSAEEAVPVWSHFLGSEKKLIVLGREDSTGKYKEFLKSLGDHEVKTVKAEDVSNEDLASHSLLFLDAADSPALSLFGNIVHPPQGFTLDTRRNPLNREHVAVLVTGSDLLEVNEAVRKLSHYGKYSYMEFSRGRNVKKTITNTSNGIRYIIDRLPAGNSTKSVSSFEQIVKALSKNRVVYVGENHASMSDHILQLRLIEALHTLNPKLAVGMEMFPKSSQPALDKYTLQDGAMQEQDFLRDSEYYDVWRYDYRYYRDILNYAKNNTLPVVALNIDREVVSQVFKDGNTDGLAPEVLNSLPKDRDLSLPGYAERLEDMYSMHSDGNHATGQQSGFIQAQAIWDESMAENITRFLEKHPDHTLVVLAGAQHTRNDSGIPPRVSRRIAVDQASVLNIYSDSTADNIAEVADYYFFSDHHELPEKPRIGIVLNTVPTAESGPRLVIEQLSPHGKAGEAGLLVGDIILRVMGVPVSSMSDLQIAMLDARAGQKISLDIFREQGTEKQELTFTVELSGAQRPAGHP